MKAKHTILAAMAVLAGAASGDDVALLEGKLKSDIMTIVDQVNPVNPDTGARRYISFAFITDFHKCKRVEGDDSATDPVKTYWYGSAGCLTEAEQSIRLLGSLATDAELDAVIAGGDFATAPIIGDGTKVGLTEEEYTNEIWNVKAMFDRHLPAAVPLFAIDGNHERSYSLNGADMHMSDAAWAYVLTNFNTSASAAHARNVDVTYHRDLAAAKLGDNQTGAYAGNSYHIDLRRLVASGGNNVRIACVSMYDGATGANPAYRAYDAGQFYDAAGNLLDADLTPENTVMGMVAHGTEEKLDGTMARAAAGTLMNGFMNGYTNPKAHTGPWNLGVQGKAFFGLVAGHLHFTNTKEITDPYDNLVNGANTVRASAVSVASAYGVNYPAKPNQHELGTEAAYHFSIFVVDTDSNKLREIRLGGWSTNPVTHESPVVQLHDFNLRTHLDPSVQTPPVLGTVTVLPGVTNATISCPISSLGTGATACDVFLAWGTDAQNLPPPTRIAEGATASFGYTISDLAAETLFYYTLSISNNAAAPMGAAKAGTFETRAAHVVPDDAILPGETPAETRQTIQDAIDAAAARSPAGTVTLGEGLFDIDAKLSVTGGVTLVGQGRENTILRYAGRKGEEGRVADIADGSVVGYVTLTGGKVDGNDKSGGGAFVTEGTITWCCVSNNVAIRSEGGGGIFVYRENDLPAKVRIDHTIVAGNAAGTNFLAGVGGGIGIRGRTGLQVEIESCLVCGNVSGKAGGALASHGGGIAVVGVDASDRFSTIIRNTTVAGNRAVGSAALGGGIYIGQPDTALVNCLFADNAADAGDGNVAFTDGTVASAVAAKTSNCLFGNGTAVFGANSVGLDGSVAFVAAAAGDYHLVDTSLVMDKGADYAGIGTDLDGRAYAWPPSIGCYEYGSGVRPPDEWDVPGPNGGGIKGIDDGNGGTYVTFTSIARTNAVLTVGFRAAKVVADGGVYGLVCKENLADAETFKIPAVLTDGADETLGTLTATLEAGTDKSTLFAVAIGPAEE